MSAARGHSRAISARLFGAVVLSAALAAGANAQSGVVSGTVKMSGGPVPNARAVLDTTRESRTDSAGRFQFRDVPAGRHRLVVLSIGATPYDVNVIVTANDTIDFDVALVKTVTLDSVLVEGSTVRQEFARAFEDRKRMGVGRYMDSLEVKKFPSVRHALLFIPGVRCFKTCDSVRFRDAIGSQEGCLPHLWIDKQSCRRNSQDVLRTMRPEDIMGIEVYTRESLIPSEFKQQGLERGCGALVVWTRRFWPEGKKKP